MMSTRQRKLSLYVVFTLCLATVFFSTPSQAQNAELYTKAFAQAKSPQQVNNPNTVVGTCTPKPNAPPADPSPDAPVANNDCFRVYEGSRSYPGIMINDTDPNGPNTIHLCGVTQPDYDRASTEVSGSLIGLNVMRNSSGGFEFSYDLCDDTGHQNSAVVTIQIVQVHKAKVVQLKGRRLEVTNPNNAYMVFSWTRDNTRALHPWQTKILYAEEKVTHWSAYLGDDYAKAGGGVLRY